MSWIRLSSLVALLSILSTFAADEPKVTRVFYLQAMDSKEAVTLLRSEVQVRQLAEVRALGLLVLQDSPERVAQSERLLRERKALARVVEPHAAESPSSPAGSTETRVFRLRGLDAPSAVTLLRAIYQIGQVTEDTDGTRISATAAVSQLDQAEALFVAMGVLARTAE